MNMENAEASKELEAMKQAHYMMIDSLKLQMETLEKELETIRNNRYRSHAAKELVCIGTVLEWPNRSNAKPY